MTLFVDASALVALIAGEPGRDDLAERIASADVLLWSAMTCWEAVTALRRSYELPVDRARQDVERTAARVGLTVVPIGEDEMRLALDAFQRYGRGTGHRAKLNMGDCFAYACARTNDARLLYKGDDFAHTDLA